MEASVRQWFEFHGNNQTASAHKDDPVLKVSGTRNA